jgi:hypothetical protein
MPLNKKGDKIMSALREQYGSDEKAKRVFYAMKNAGKIEGVEGKDHEPVADADGRMWSRGVPLSDIGIVDGVRKTTDGYLAGQAKVARIGTQKYRGFEVGQPQRDSVTLYRPPEEVFTRDAMHSMANKPITLTHPKRMVDARTWSKVAKGFSGNEVLRDGEFVSVPLLLTDHEAISAFEDGTRELSVGYLTDLDWTPGEAPDGTKYDGVQRDIHCNHHALVPVARGGRGLTLGDAAVCADCGGPMSMKDSTYVCDNCGSTAMRDWDSGDDDDEDDEDGKKKPFKGAAKPFKSEDAWPEAELYDRDVGPEERKSLAEKGKALPGGGFPIKNVGDLRNAIQAFGRAKNPAATKALIKRRAKELGAESALPEDWTNGGSSSAKDAATSRGVRDMAIIETMDGFPISFADENSAMVARQLFARLNKKIRDQADKDDDDADEKVKKEQDREKAERGYKDAIAARDGEISVLKKQLQDASFTDAQKDVMLAERQALVDQSTPFLPQGFKTHGVPMATIRRTVVGHALGDSKVKDWEDARVTGAFDALVAGARPAPTGLNRMATGMTDALRQTEGWMGQGPHQPTSANDAETEWRKMVDRNANAYKDKTGYQPN